MTPSAFTVEGLTVNAIGTESGGGTPPPGGGTIQLIGYSHYDITTTNFNVTIHANALENDIALVHAGGRSGAAFTPPAGYAGQQIFTYDEGGNTKHDCWWRRLGAGEASSIEAWTTSNYTRQNMLGISFWRGCLLSGDPQDVTHVKFSEYDDTPACPAITTVTNESMIVYLLAQRYNGTAPPEDTGYPAGVDGAYKQWFNPSILGMAYTEKTVAGLVPGNEWGAWSLENNLAIVTSLALKPEP